MNAPSPSVAAQQTADAPLVQLTNVTVDFGSRRVLDSINLSIAPGTKVSIVGPNGGGKTTLLKVLLGSLKPTAGTVHSKANLTVGYQPQRTVVDPSMPLSVRSLLQLTATNKNDEHLAAYLATLELPRSCLTAQVTTLSGGERQRVMIARAMLSNPELLVLDEPGTYCDQRNLSALYQVVENFSATSNCATLVVSHDITRVLAHSDHILCISTSLLCEGGPDQIVRDTEFETLFGEPAFTGIYRHRH